MYLVLSMLGLCCFLWASLAAASRGLLCVAMRGLLTAVASLVAELRLLSVRASGAAVSSSRAPPQKLWCTGHGGSSCPRDPTRVSCIGKWILYHWATREALFLWMLISLWWFLYWVLCLGSRRNLTLSRFSWVQFIHSVVSDSLWPHELQHARPTCP